MTRQISVSGILNEIAAPVRALAAPWVGVLILFVLPLRLLQVYFVNTLIELGDAAGSYGNLLRSIALLACAASLLATYGRAVFARAVQRALARERTVGDAPFRIRPAALMNLLYITLLLQIGLTALAFTIVAIPIFAVLLGIAIATVDRHERPSVREPLLLIGRFLGEARVLIGVTLVFGVALIAAWINLMFAARLGLWLAEAIPTVALDRWHLLLSAEHRLFSLLLLAGALIAIEPFWMAANVVYVKRVQSKESGDDLRHRFRDLIATETAGRKLAMAILVAAALLVPRNAAAETLSLPDYALKLESIDLALAANDRPRAAAEASAIAGMEIEAGGERFRADRSLLDPIAQQEEDVFESRARLGTLIAELRRGGGVPAPKIDEGLLEKIREAQKVDPLKRGGSIATVPRSDSRVWDLIAEWYNAAIEWLANKFEWLFDWLRKLWPKPGEEGESFDIRLLVLIVTLLIVGLLIALAVAILRRSKRRAAVAESTPLILDEKRDADPLSREANEWERYAMELARAGRLREAVRAWYHAVLVALYRAGVLNYRKGATNWEYVTRLSPSLAWRSKFVEMTRAFEREWYGRDRSSAEALEHQASVARTILAAVRTGSER